MTRQFAPHYEGYPEHPPQRSSQHYDIVIIGGGITGAGVAREAAAAGLMTLLVEQKDYAWGTSSRSSKMIHGGLRYLAGGHFRLTRDAVRERQRMLEEAPGLVDRMRYFMPHYRGRFPGPRAFNLALRLYDSFGGERYRHRIDPVEMLHWLPGLNPDGLLGVTGFSDAVTDDARLVLRTLSEARQLGAVTNNYLKASQVERREDGKWTVSLADQRPDGHPDQVVTAGVVVNATGAWADRLWRGKNTGETIRPLRGSHLVVPFGRLPVSVCVTLVHPEDKRPIFIYPWLGQTVIGTTDLDHTGDLDQEPVITNEEVDYLFRAVEDAFPSACLTRCDVLSSWSGIRPVVSQGSGLTPSRESREHVVWNQDGLVSVAGGKLTTFRLIAREVLLISTPYLNNLTLPSEEQPLFQPAPAIPRPEPIRHLTWRRLQGHYGPALPNMLEAGPLEEVAGTGWLWAELHWAATCEEVVHLDDLLLRRTRLGLVLPNGGSELLDELEARLKPKLGWNDQRWADERKRYQELWQRAYYLPQERLPEKHLPQEHRSPEYQEQKDQSPEAVAR